MIKLLNLNYWIKLSILTSSLILITSCGQEMSEQQMLDKAKTYLHDGKLSSAAIELRNTLQKNSTNAEARYLLGTISLKIGLLESADKEFRRAAIAGWIEEQTQLELARVYIPRKKFQRLLDDITINDTWSLETRSNISALRALAEASLNHIPQARTTLDEGKKYKPETFHVLKTTILFQLTGILEGDVSETLKKTLSLYPDESELMLLQAYYDSSNKNYAQASETFNRIISFDPNSLVTLDGRNARIGLARIQLLEKHYELADQTLAPLLKINHKDPVANYLSSLIAFDQGNYHEAEKYMRKLLHLVPNHIQAQQLMGNIKFALKDFDQAAHHLTASVMRTPDDLVVYKLLIKTYIALNKKIEAKITVKKALSIRPDDTETLALASQIMFSEGDTTAGLAILKQALQLNPEDIYLHKQLAKFYIANGDTDKAFLEIKKFEILSKDNIETMQLYIHAYLKTGDLSKALNIARDMLTNNPDNPEVNLLTGRLHTFDNDYKQARINYVKALQLKQDFPAATIALARLEAYEGNFDAAIDLYKGLVQANKGGINPMLALSELASQQKNKTEMLYWLEQARETSPADTKSRASLASHYLANDQPKKADRYIQEAILISPENVKLLALHGKVLLAQKRYKDALLSLKKVVNKLPDSKNARVVLAETYLLMKLPAQARKHLQIALKAHENDILVLSLLAETELKDNEYDQSLDYALLLQKTQPEHYAGYLHEGNVWLAKQEYKKSYSAFTNAWERHHSAGLSKNLFTAAKHYESVDVATVPLIKWIADHPNDYATRFYLAAAYQNAGRNDLAIDEYEKILASTPDSSSLLNNLAWLYSLEGNPQALDLSERAYRLSPEDPGVLDTYGWVLIQQGQVEKGRRLLYLATNKAPKNLEIQYHYATALIKSGDRNNGIQILEELISSDKSFVGRQDATQLLGK